MGDEVVDEVRERSVKKVKLEVVDPSRSSCLRGRVRAK